MCENHANILHFRVIKRKMTFRLAYRALVIAMIFVIDERFEVMDFFFRLNSN